MEFKQENVKIVELYNQGDVIEQIDDNLEKESLYTCNSCNIHFSDIEDHIKKYHNNHETETANEGANDQEIFLEELQDTDNEINLALIVKNSEGRYECNECTRTFKVYKRFLTHLKSHHSLMVEDYGSLEQGKYRHEKKESEYTEVHKEDGTIDYRCKSCLAEFDSRKRLLLHLSIHKNVRDAQSECQVGETSNINCQLCNKTFTRKTDFDLHIQAHKAGSSDKNVPKTIGTPRKGIHPCQYCGKEFKRPHEKVKHERIHSGLKPYSCDICGKQFRVTYCLSLHKRNVHSDDRPYICTFSGCNKSYKAQSAYNHHINTHSFERKFQCPFCPKTFKTSVQLAGHKNTHLKPFSCQQCKRPFSSLYAVKNHMSTHLNEDSNLKLTCKICGAQYARSFALKDHMQTTHPEMDIEIEEYIIESEVTNSESDVYSVVISENDDN